MCPYDPKEHHRRSIRLSGFDYAQAAVYFVTICTHENRCVLGRVVGDAIVLSASGEVAQACWCAIREHSPDVFLDEFALMPNHLHGLLALGVASPAKRDTPYRVDPLLPSSRTVTPTPALQPDSVSALMGSFKSAVTRQVNRAKGTPGAPLWHRNYYERIVRDDKELKAVREYIRGNPIRWSLDRLNPNSLPKTQDVLPWE